jgi:hypothetical protein
MDQHTVHGRATKRMVLNKKNLGKDLQGVFKHKCEGILIKKMVIGSKMFIS